MKRKKVEVIFSMLSNIARQNITKSVVFCPAHKTSLEAMLLIADYIQSEKGFRSVFLLGSPNMLGESGRIVKAGFRVEKIKPYKWNCENKLIYRFRQAVSGRIHKWVLSGNTVPDWLFLNTDEFYKRLAQYYRDVTSILRRVNPVSIVVPDDRCLAYGFLPAIIKACGILDIPRVIPPISYAADRRDLGRASHRQTQYVSDDNKLFKRYSGNLLCNKKVKQRAISFYPPIITEILYRFDVLPENPWVMGGGHSDLVLVDGKETKSRYIKYGCDPRKIIVTGHPAHDDLYNVFKNKIKVRARLNKKYDLDSQHLTILALPQLGEHKILSWGEHWREIRFLCESFSKGQGDTLVSLHPKMDRKQYLFIESEYDIPIVDEPLREILPAADSFAATFSSTVEWAVLCKVPTIVFDYYDLNYDVYDDLEGVVITNDQQLLSSILDHIQSDVGYLEKLSKSHAEKASKLSPFDGKCMIRVVRACCHPDEYAQPSKRI